MQILRYIFDDDWPVYTEEIDLAGLYHKVKNAVAKCFQVISPRLVHALVSSDWCIFDCPEESMEFFLDVLAILIILYLSAKVGNVDLSIFDSEIWRLDVSVQVPEIMELFEDVKHFHGNLWNHLVLLFKALGHYKIFNTLR